MEVQGPNSVEVTWQAPPLVHHNGPILSYIIRYFPSNESDMTQDSHVTADGDEAIQRKTLYIESGGRTTSAKANGDNAPLNAI